MTRRLALAAALVAAAGLACTNSPKPSTPQVARKASVARKVGSYSMTVTPIPESGGRQASMTVVPDGGFAGAVHVSGAFSATIEPAAGAGCAGQSLQAALTATNLAVEPMANVQMQIVSMSQTGYEVCKTVGGPGSSTALLPTPANTSPGAALGLGGYGTLAGGGGNASINWWFKFPVNTPVTFKFVVWADPQEPVLDPLGPDITVGQPLTWTSTGSATSSLELCTVDPAFTNNRCPALSLTTTAGVATGPVGGVYAFSATPTLTPGVTYWWRAVNTFAGVKASYASGWDTFTASAVFAPPPPTIVTPALSPFPADSLVNALPVLLEWDTATPDVTAALYQICTGPCPAPGALPADPNFANLVVENVELWTPPLVPLGPGYSVDVSAFLPLDPASANTWILPGTYTWQVYNYDELNAVAFGTPAASTFVITPATGPSPTVISPLPGDAFLASAPITLSPIELIFETDPAVADAQYLVCSGAAATCPGALNVNLLATANVVGTPAFPGAPTSYAIVDLVPLLPTDPNTGDTWLLPGAYSVVVSNFDPLLGVAVGTPTAVDFSIASAMPALPVLNAANVGPFPANSFAAAKPVPLTWTSDPVASATEVDLCDTADCLSVLYGTFQVTAVGTTFSYDPAVVPDLPLDVNGGYLQTGTFYYTVYNVDPLNPAQRLLPGVTGTVTIAAVPTGPAAWTLPAFAQHSRADGPIALAWTGPTDVSASTIEFYDDVLLTIPSAGFFAPVASSTVPPAASAFAIPDVRAQLATDQIYYYRVVDDSLVAAILAGVPAPLWSATGSIEIIP